MTDFDSDVADYRERLAAAGLGRFADQLASLARRSVRLIPDLDAPPTVGACRLGGLPDLPADTPWPRNDDSPLSFIAQINLAEVAPFEHEAALPREGLLSFFYEAVTQEAWGFDPADHGAAVVLFTPAKAEIHQRVAPDDLSPDGRFHPLALRPGAETTFAPWESFDVEVLGMSREELFAYGGVFGDEDSTSHRLLGHPDPIQGDMQLECQLVTNGINCGRASGYNDPRAAELRNGAADWRLLLQIDSQDEAEMMWGDVGRIYFWIKDTDLANRDWELSWLILQCC